MADVNLSTKGLDRLIKALKEAPSVKVGVLKDDARSDGKKGKGLTNPEIGAIHEFGTTKSPQRSFLRIPISEHLDKRLEDAGLLDKDNMAKILRAGSVELVMKMIGIIAEGIVADAFDTGGFGAWIPSNMKYKKNHQTLLETQQLRNSITSEVTTKAS